MKRFYREVAVAGREGRFTVTLDGRPIRTPAKLEFVVPYRPLAEAIATEWRDQGETLALASMRLTRFANTALDFVGGRREEVIRQIAAFAETDLVCYRADEPPELVARQADTWDPLLAWLERAHGARLGAVSGIAPRPQDRQQLLAITVAIARFDSFPLTALHAATTACGSVVIGLALADGHIDAAAAFAASHVDELWQVERWGSDAEAERRRAAIRADIAAAERFFSLCRQDG